MKIVIITEGNRQTGFGHVMRCLSFYQAFQEKGFAPLMVINGDDSVTEILQDVNHVVLNWLDAADNLKSILQDASIVLVDSYLADVALYEYLSSTVKTPVYIDDTMRLPYPKGIVVNGAIGAEKLSYSNADDITYLLGLQYQPLRKSFWKTTDVPVKQDIESVMVTMGGNDMRNLTPQILQMLVANFPTLQKNIVIGHAYSNLEEIKKYKDENTHFILHPDAEQMKDVMMNSDVAITAAGQTIYELAALHKPIIAILVAENQRNSMMGWQQTNLVYTVEWTDSNCVEQLANYVEALKDFTLRTNIHQTLSTLFNGSGVQKTIDRILELQHAH